MVPVFSLVMAIIGVIIFALVYLYMEKHLPSTLIGYIAFTLGVIVCGMAVIKITFDGVKIIMGGFTA